MAIITRVAALLNETEAEARAFCNSVQQEIKGAPPSFKIIADFLELHPEAKDNATELAQIIMTHHPAIAQQLRSQQGRSRHHKTKSSGNGDHTGGDTLPTISPMQAHDPRRFTDNLSKCPHGVPKVRKCAICDPEGYRLENG